MFKLRIDNIKPNKIFFYWTIYIGIISLIYLSTEIFVPEPYEYINLKNQIINKKSYNNTYFKLNNTIEYTANISDLETHNQFLLLGLSKKNDIKIKKQEHTFNNIYQYINSKKYKMEFELTVNKSEKQIFNINNKIKIDPKLKKNYFPYFYNNNYKNIDINLKLISPNDYTLNDEYNFFLETNNDKFINFIIIIKIILMFFSIISYIIYNKSVNEILKKYILKEQEMIKILGIILILFNNPIYFIIYHFPSFWILIFGSIINNGIYSYIIYMWMIIFCQIENETKKNSKKSNIIFYNILVYIQFLIGTLRVILNSYMYLDDPIEIIKESYIIYYDIIYYINVILCLIMISVILKHLFFINLNKDNLLLRQKIFIIFSLYFILTFCLFVITGNTNIYYDNSEKAHLIIMITNLYIFMLQYLFSISYKGLQELNKFKKQKIKNLNIDDNELGIIEVKDENDTML